MGQENTSPDERHYDLFKSQGIKGLQPEITGKLDVIKAVFEQYAAGGKFELTAAQEWEGHELMSLHHTGFAVDVRTRTLPGGGYGPLAKTIANKIQDKLGKTYYILLHKPPTAPHIHIQYQKGVRISSPADFRSPGELPRRGSAIG